MSFFPAGIFIGVKHAMAAKKSPTAPDVVKPVKPPVSVGKAIAGLLMLGPFPLFLSSGARLWVD
jgi:hypothetical protein